MKKQTAVEWFEYNLKDNLGKIVIKQNWELLEDLLKQAKQMEKYQIIVAHYEGSENYRRQYYNETYKSKLKD
jgi:hypothetical protein